jgi:hypothetical protein
MRILNEDNDKPVDQMQLFLTKDEAEEMIDSLKHLLEKPNGNHSHISNEDFQKEITVCIYDENDPDNMKWFDERTTNLIKNNQF